MKIKRIWLLAIGLSVQCIAHAQLSKNDTKSKPNVLLIYTDDHRFSGIHALGGMQVKTPNIDKLAKEGVVFTNTYLMGAFNGATCVPSRAMLLTGRDLFHLKETGNVIPENHITIGETFLKAGYDAHAVGKWHQDNQTLSRSFNSGDRIMSRAGYLTDHFRMPVWDWRKDGKYTAKEGHIYEYDKNGKIIQRALSENDVKGPIGTEKNGPHSSEIWAESAANYIQNHDKNKPFFMYLAFHAPHDPRQAPEKYKKMYPLKDIILPPSYLPVHPFDNGEMTVRDEALAPWPRTEQVAKEHLAAYYAIITHLDEQIGKVIEALKKSGQYDNTVIVLAGDSGLTVGNHGLIGKQNVYDEDGIHVPFIISGNLVKNKGARIDALSYIHDIYPTICDFVNVPIPPSVIGQSLVPVINKEKEAVRDFTYHAYKQFQRAYRKGDYKLIEYVKSKGIGDDKKGESVTGSRVTQLFNYKKDPWETTNLAFLTEYKEIVDKMRKEMLEKSIEIGDSQGNTLGQKYNFWDNL